jgi:DNA-binding NarL/FixJ family response regulator
MPNTTRRLLIVDDDPALLHAVADCLRAEGYEVTTARSGAEALSRLAAYPPDLVISDIRMPRMDGYTLARNIRNAPRTALIPIIFLTAKDQKADRIDGFRAGVDAYLVKPFEPDELLTVVASILSRVERTHSEIARLTGAAPTEDRRALHDEELTDAEWRVAEAVANALSNKEIAAELGISIRTAEKHISNILSKKNFDNRVEIARLVFERKPSD